jgi:hypothetical protein
VREPAPPYPGEGPHALWHVSEDSSIRLFRPHRSATAPSDELLVWAVDTRHLPMFWFPRQCPRATFWTDSDTTAGDAERFICGSALRVHAIEGGWLARFHEARVVAYRLPEETFTPYEEAGGYWTSPEAVAPLELVELGNLADRHVEAEIELRIVPNLWPLWERVTASTLQFSGIRLHNAQPVSRA